MKVKLQQPKTTKSKKSSDFKTHQASNSYYSCPAECRKQATPKNPPRFVNNPPKGPIAHLRRTILPLQPSSRTVSDGPSLWRVYIGFGLAGCIGAPSTFFGYFALGASKGSGLRPRSLCGGTSRICGSCSTAFQCGVGYETGVGAGAGEEAVSQEDGAEELAGS